jgi:hypothetical protein
MPLSNLFRAQGRARQGHARVAWLGALLALCSCAAAAAEYTIAPTPDWVLPQPAATPRDGATLPGEGVTYLLVDSQVRATATARTRYFRYVSQARTAKGVESIANLGIDFDPGWQRLQLHAVRVLRGGRAIDKLARARIEVIQQEKELDELIYNGSKTVKIFLDDVRVGDVVDYSFSTSGRNPVFGGREFGATDLQWGVPVARMHARLLLPAEAAIRVRTRNSALKPSVSEHDGLRDYRWSAQDTPALVVEEGAPDWYAPFAEVEWSAFPDWAAVSRWALPLYRRPARLGPELEAELARIAREQRGETARMLAVLRFVQHEVRYLGVETGRNTHAPNPPALVFARRFGDCKDKALLMLSMLSRLGITGHPALVNTRSRRGIAERLPTPSAFDHVIVRARADGKDYWLDPTRPTQESEAAYLYQPDFHLALVVAPGTSALTPMRGPGSRSRRSVQMQFDARGDFESPVGLRVVTTYEGGAAEAQRDELADDTPEELQRRYLEYYSGSYPGIAVAAPLHIEDDRRHNRLVTTERYAIAGFAGKPGEDGRHTAWIETPDVDDLLKDPQYKRRNAPLELDFPLEVSQTTEVLLPEPWDLKTSEARIDDPAFSFRRSVRADADRRRLVIRDDYRTLADEVAAKAMPRYTANLAKARGQLGYSLTWSDALPPPLAGVPAARWLDRLNWPVLLLTLAVFAACAWAARVAWRYDPAPRPAAPDAPRGLGGWLWVFGSYVLLAPIAHLLQAYRALPNLAMPQWSSLTTFGGAQYHPGWAPLLLGEWLSNLGLFMASLMLAALFVRRRSSFPRVAMVVLVAASLCFVVDFAGAAAMPGSAVEPRQWGELAGNILATALWLGYLLRSQRVGATFTGRLARGQRRVVSPEAVVPPPLPLPAGVPPHAAPAPPREPALA